MTMASSRQLRRSVPTLLTSSFPSPAISLARATAQRYNCTRARATIPTTSTANPIYIANRSQHYHHHHHHHHRLFSSFSPRRSASLTPERRESKLFPDADTAVADVQSGSTILSSGFGLCGVAETLITALHRRGRDSLHSLTAVSNNAGVEGKGGLSTLTKGGQVDRLVLSYLGSNKVLERKYLTGEIAIELCPQGTLAERIRCAGSGIPAFFTATGARKFSFSSSSSSSPSTSSSFSPFIDNPQTNQLTPRHQTPSSRKARSPTVSMPPGVSSSPAGAARRASSTARPT